MEYRINGIAPNRFVIVWRNGQRLAVSDMKALHLVIRNDHRKQIAQVIPTRLDEEDLYFFDGEGWRKTTTPMGAPSRFIVHVPQRVRTLCLPALRKAAA